MTRLKLQLTIHKSFSIAHINQFSLFIQSVQTFKMKFFLLSICFAAFFSQCLSQNKFIVDVVDFTSSDFNTSMFRCYGVVISPRHVVAPASCVTPRSSRSIGILASSQSSGKNASTYSKSKLHVQKILFDYFVLISASADKVTIHPEYVSGQNFKSNIAVIRVSNKKYKVKNLSSNIFL